jgi:hypothetical protein
MSSHLRKYKSQYHKYLCYRISEIMVWYYEKIRIIITYVHTQR